MGAFLEVDEARFGARRPRDAGSGSELRTPGAAAQTRIVSVARIRLDSRKSVRPFKGIICDDISEFESYMLSQAVRSPSVVIGAVSFSELAWVIAC